jgi:hypothetical protein
VASIERFEVNKVNEYEFALSAEIMDKKLRKDKVGHCLWANSL